MSRKTLCRIKLSILLLLLQSVVCIAGKDTENRTHDGGMRTSDSAIRGTSVRRDPFWPVGYQPAQPRENEEKPDAEIQEQIEWPRLKLTGITRSSHGYIAIIDGVGLVETGDTISFERDGMVFRLRIDAIVKDGVSCTKLNVRSAGRDAEKQK